jgi:hypothetical protein
MPPSTPPPGRGDSIHRGSLQSTNDQQAATSHLGPTQSTPISKKSSGSKPFSSEEITRERRFLELATETKGMYMGPIPPEEFLDNFLSVHLPPLQSTESVDAEDSNALKASNREEIVAPHLVCILILFTVRQPGSRTLTHCLVSRSIHSLHWSGPNSSWFTLVPNPTRSAVVSGPIFRYTSCRMTRLAILPPIQWIVPTSQEWNYLSS